MVAQSPNPVEEAYAMLAPCRVCPRHCGVDRLNGERGFCGVGNRPVVSSAGPHFGEESCLVGRGGSGTIFLAGCNLGCVYCQNYDISHLRRGTAVDVDDLVQITLALQGRGCENINFVSPTHTAPALLDAIVRARAAGLKRPVVWNCGGYEAIDMLRLLDGHVDIYMPDVKYADSTTAERLSRAANYPTVVREAVREMHRQVGDLVLRDGVAVKGLLIRHLVLPAGLAGSEHVIDFLADGVSPNTFVNVMGQYRPEYQADRYDELTRCPTRKEIADVEAYAARRGLRLAD
jgi:putative pyruvate formate lyase activating enzyme